MEGDPQYHPTSENTTAPFQARPSGDSETILEAITVINAEFGSPRIARFGEKGTYWVQIKAEGVAA